MLEESNARNLDHQQIQVGKTKTLEGHKNCVIKILCRDNLIISGSVDKTIRITPISLFPGELGVFQSTMNSFNLAHHLEREIRDYFDAR